MHALYYVHLNGGFVRAGAVEASPTRTTPDVMNTSDPFCPPRACNHAERVGPRESSHDNRVGSLPLPLPFPVPVSLTQ